MGTSSSQPVIGDPPDMSPLMHLPIELWGEVCSYFGNDGKNLSRFMVCSKHTHSMVKSGGGLTRLHITVPSTTTKLNGFPSHWFTPYPNLNSLGLYSGPGQKITMTAKDVEGLPRTLKCLVFGFVDPISDEMVPLLPPNLELLHLIHNNRMTDQAFTLFGSKLKSLHLPNNYNITSQGLERLPEQITSVTLHLNNILEPTSTSKLPNTLTSLELHSSYPTNPICLQKLPTSINRLNWKVGSSLEASDVAYLQTPDLIELSFVSAATDTANKIFANLPRSLLRLNNFGLAKLDLESILMLPPNIADLEFHSFTSVGPQNPALSLTYPKSLTRLSLPNVSSMVRFPVEGLPQTLQVLNLPKCVSWKNAWFFWLPTALHTLSITWNEEITVDLIRYAPVSLTQLTLRAKYNLGMEYMKQPIDTAFPDILTMPRCMRFLPNADWDKINIVPFDSFVLQLHIPGKPSSIPLLDTVSDSVDSVAIDPSLSGLLPTPCAYPPMGWPLASGTFIKQIDIIPKQTSNFWIDNMSRK